MTAQKKRGKHSSFLLSERVCSKTPRGCLKLQIALNLIYTKLFFHSIYTYYIRP